MAHGVKGVRTVDFTRPQRSRHRRLGHPAGRRPRRQDPRHRQCLRRNLRGRLGTVSGRNPGPLTDMGLGVVDSLCRIRFLLRRAAVVTDDRLRAHPDLRHVQWLGSDQSQRKRRPPRRCLQVPRRRPPELRRRCDTPLSAADAARGAALYSANCAACHQPTGRGLAGVFPPLAGDPVVNGSDPTEHITTILNGRQGSTIGGVTYASPMPGFKELLNDADLAAIVNHERTSWGNAAPLVRASEVAKLRD